MFDVNSLNIKYRIFSTKTYQIKYKCYSSRLYHRSTEFFPSSLFSISTTPGTPQFGLQYQAGKLAAFHFTGPAVMVHACWACFENIHGASETFYYSYKNSVCKYKYIECIIYIILTTYRKVQLYRQ